VNVSGWHRNHNDYDDGNDDNVEAAAAAAAAADDDDDDDDECCLYGSRIHNGHDVLWAADTGHRHRAGPRTAAV